METAQKYVTKGFTGIDRNDYSSKASGDNSRMPTRLFYEGAGGKPHNTVTKDQKPGLKNDLYSDDASPNYTEDDLLLFLEQLGLVDLGMDTLLSRNRRQPASSYSQGFAGSLPVSRYSGARNSLQSRPALSPQYSLGLGHRASPNNKYGGLDSLLSAVPYNAKGTQERGQLSPQQYSGLNVQYLGSDGTMYQLSAMGPAGNKKQMVSQVLTGLYSVLMNESYGSKSPKIGYGGGQSQGKGQGSLGSGDNYGGSGGSYGKN
jgi:hypothetical protein